MVAITDYNRDSYYGGAMPLDDLLNEVMKIKASGRPATLLSDDRISELNSSSKKANTASKIRSIIAYGLGGKYGDLFY
jgi:hypothetical protein